VRPGRRAVDSNYPTWLISNPLARTPAFESVAPSSSFQEIPRLNANLFAQGTAFLRLTMARAWPRRGWSTKDTKQIWPYTIWRKDKVGPRRRRRPGTLAVRFSESSRFCRNADALARESKANAAEEKIAQFREFVPLLCLYFHTRRLRRASRYKWSLFDYFKLFLNYIITQRHEEHISELAKSSRENSRLNDQSDATRGMVNTHDQDCTESHIFRSVRLLSLGASTCARDDRVPSLRSASDRREWRCEKIVDTRENEKRAVQRLIGGISRSILFPRHAVPRSSLVI